MTPETDTADLGEHLLDDLTAIVSRAAAAIMTARAGSLHARLKADRSPVTAADEAAEAVILEGLARLLPDLAVLSEESGLKGAGIGRRFVLVDPLDGTREFLAGREEYTVNVAILQDRAPVVGVVAAPAQGLVWRGIVGRGAERLRLSPGASPQEATERIAIRTRAWPGERAVAAISRSHLDSRTREFLARWPRITQVASGSSVKFCRLAEGAADVYPRLSATREWDIAAGHAVLRAAGGAVLTPDGNDIVYGRGERDFQIPAFIAWGDPKAAASFR